MKKILILLLIACISPLAFASPPDKRPLDMPEAIDISEYILKDEFFSDLDGDGTKEKVQLLYKHTNDTFALFILVVYKDNMPYHQGKTILAPKDYCVIDEMVISPDHNPFITVGFPIGAHSEWLGIYKFNGKEVSEINNLYSDQPLIMYEDFNNDGVQDITIVNRNYDTDPVHDSLITKYKYKNGKFREIPLSEY